LQDRISLNPAKKNVIWNLFGGAWVGVLVVIATPWYVTLLGFEGYAIVGLWSVMQVMMGLLDIGMGAALVREFADSRGDRNDLEFKRNLLKTLEIVYWVVAGILVLILMFAASWIVDHWLQLNSLPVLTIRNAILLMAIALGFQFPCGLYINGLAGMQEHARLNALHIMGNTLRYGTGVAMLLWRADLVWFFVVQAIVAAIQTFATRKILWVMISVVGASPAVFSIKLLQRLWSFSIGMALTSGSAVLLANVDRIALSKMVSAEDLGKYAVAFTATGLLQMGIQPFYRVFYPRYSELVSAGDTSRLRAEYYQSSRLMAVIIIPLGFIGWAFAPQILYGWIEKYDHTIIDIFRWLLIGTLFSGIMWLPVAFQQAHGWTTLHASMIISALLIGTPIMLYSIKNFGVTGATVLWIIHGVQGITLGLWLMHRRLLKGELSTWYITVLMPPILSSSVIVIISKWLYPAVNNKWISLVWIGLTMILGVIASYKWAIHFKKIG